MDRTFDLDQQTWSRIRKAIDRQTRRLQRRYGKLAKALYPDTLIAGMYFWCVWHDRPLSWACQKHHYGRLFRPRKLPSISQFCKRLATERFEQLLGMIHQELAAWSSPVSLGYLDGKPLPVSAVSKDPQAKPGHVLGGFAKGYKLHAFVSEDRRFLLWSVQSLNRGEVPVAQALSEQLPPLVGAGMVLGDGEYDAGVLYEALAQKNACLLAWPRGYAKSRAAGKGPLDKSAKALRCSGPIRNAALGLWQAYPRWSRSLYNKRIEVEASFSNLSSFGGGLGPLPAWVRTLPRVRRWVGTKIIIYHARLEARKARERVA